MRYALDMRTFWFSHYLSTGLRTSNGILAVALGALFVLPTRPAVAMAMAFGAGCLALVDQTGPFQGKARELTVAALLNTLASLWIALLTGHPLAQMASIVAITFSSAFLLLYGKRAMPVQFSILLTMTLPFEHVDRRADALLMTGGFFAGTPIYLGYALAVAWWQRQRSKQQVLAECLFELARHLDIKTGFYARKADIDRQFTALIRQQVALAEKQQAARDLVLQHHRAAAPQDGRLIQIHLGMLNVYGQILSTHTDYQALHQHFGGSDTMMFLRDLVAKATADVEAIAYAVTRDHASESPVSYTAEKRALEFEIHLLQQKVQQGRTPQHVLTLLRATYQKIAETISRIHLLHAATQVQQIKLPPINLALFVSRPRIDCAQVRCHLSMRSPIFRYAMRISLAMLAAMLLGSVLPYAAHAYWIMLTIAIIMKPSYSTTRERRTKRMAGMALGCALAAAVLHFVHDPVALLCILYLSLTVSATFVQIRYVYTAAAATLTVMILLHFTGSTGGTGLMAERLMDTLIGVGIASLFSHVFPSWERQALPLLLQRLLDSARAFMRESHQLLLHDATQDQAYRLARKQFLDQIANVNGALLRMLDEPEGRQHGVPEINQLLVRTYIMASHVAALRMLLRRQPWLQQNATYRALIGHSITHADRWPQLAQAALQPTPPLPPDAPETSAPAEAEDWLPAPLDEAQLPGSEAHTRIVLQEDAHQLVQHSQRVREALGLQTATTPA